MSAELKKFIALFMSLLSVPSIAFADQGGVSYWIPGFFGSLAAAPQQPGWSLTNIDYQTSVSASGDVAIARERTLGKIPVNLSLSANPNASLSSRADFNFPTLTYVFKTPVLGGQASFDLLGALAAWILPLVHSWPARYQPHWAPSHFRAPTQSTA